MSEFKLEVPAGVAVSITTSTGNPTTITLRPGTYALPLSQLALAAEGLKANMHLLAQAAKPVDGEDG